MLILGTTLAFLELATDEAALPTGLSEFSPASALMRIAIWRHKAQSIVHTAFFGLNETRGTDRSRSHSEVILKIYFMEPASSILSMTYWEVKS